jgi:predicted Zn-dependent protease
MSVPAPAGNETQAVPAAPGSGGDGQEGKAPSPGKGARALREALARWRRSRRLWAAFVLLGLLVAGGALLVPRLRAWRHFRAARVELERDHNRQAVRHLQACLRAWPNDPDVLLMAARAARRARSYDEAEGCLEKYQQGRGLDDAGGFERLLLSAEGTLDSHVVSRCHRFVQQDHPETPLILEALARGYLRQYRLNEARVCLEVWLKREPDNPQALALMGQFHLDYERAPDRAVTKYRRAVEIDPDHEDARLGLAITLLESRDFAGAVPHLERLAQDQPDNLRIQVGLADCRYALDESDAALRLLDDILDRQPNYAPALALRGRIAVENGENAAAETWLRLAVEQNPSDNQARYTLIRCLHRNGKSKEAEGHEKWLAQREKDVKRFHEIVTRDLVKSPHDPALSCTLGRLLLRSGHEAEGLRWLKNALRQDPGYAPARQALAEYARKRKTDEQPLDRAAHRP